MSVMGNRAGSRRVWSVMMRKAVGVIFIMGGIASLLVLDQVDIVVNGTRSLEAKAFVMWERPVLLNEGAVVSAEMPDLLKDKFGEFLFVKRIGGMPGDHVSVRDDGAPCVRDVCYTLAKKDGKPVGSALPEGTIPEGHYALFGDGETSLDSRYAAIGLVSLDDLKGRGWAIPWVADWRGHSE